VQPAPPYLVTPEDVVGNAALRVTCAMLNAGRRGGHHVVDERHRVVAAQVEIESKR